MGANAVQHEVSRHKCLIYDGDPSEQLPVVVPLLMDGLQENWRCLYLGSPDTVQMVDTALSAKGIDTASAKRRNALVLSSDRSQVGDFFSATLNEPVALVSPRCFNMLLAEVSAPVD